jgi:hypothetical protein
VITKARYCEGETFAEFMARETINHALWVGITHHVSIPLEMSARVQALGGHWHLLVLSEDWCGDAVNIVPIVAKLAESVSNMDLRIPQQEVRGVRVVGTASARVTEVGGGEGNGASEG